MFPIKGRRLRRLREVKDSDERHQDGPYPELPVLLLHFADGSHHLSLGVLQDVEGLYLIITAWSFPPITIRKWYLAGIGRLRKNFLSLTWGLMSRVYRLRRQWIATQNSPFSFVLTLSGDPGKIAKRSTVPAFSPFNQYLLNLSQNTNSGGFKIKNSPMANFLLYFYMAKQPPSKILYLHFKS
jgi:hypothetical protein